MLQSKTPKPWRVLIAEETGKALWESRTEVAAMIGKIAISKQAHQERTGTVENPMPGAKAFIRHKPHGVVAVFGPYNFPGHLPNGHIVPALIAGNAVVFKPSELTPKVAEYTVQLWQQAGLPAGVLTLLQGEVATGKALAAHPGSMAYFLPVAQAQGITCISSLLVSQAKFWRWKWVVITRSLSKTLPISKLRCMTLFSRLLSARGQRCTCARRLFVPKTANGDAILAKAGCCNQKDQSGRPFADRAAILWRDD